MIKILMKILKAELSGEMLDEELKNQITSQLIAQFYHILGVHDILHIVGMALKKNQVIQDDDMLKLYVHYIHSTAMRMEWIIGEQNEIIHLFEAEGIDYLPLKGAKIRQYYPQAWMRTSSDIDILVRSEQLDRAVNLLTEKRGYQVQRKNYHDIVLYAPNGVRIELHFSILEYDESIDSILNRVWDYSVRTSETLHGYEMKPEYFMFHLIAHMYYHFVHGGCGIRFFLDLWLLNKQLNYDKVEFNELCKECGLKTFVEYVWKIIEIWFGDAEHDSVTKRMETYIVTGGLYGNQKSKVTVAKLDTESKNHYIFKRLFVSRSDLGNVYPELKSRPYLYFYYSIRRWFAAYKEGRLNQISDELFLNKTIKDNEVDELKVLFRNLKLKKRCK